MDKKEVKKQVNESLRAGDSKLEIFKEPLIYS